MISLRKRFFPRTLRPLGAAAGLALVALVAASGSAAAQILGQDCNACEKFGAGEAPYELTGDSAQNEARFEAARASAVNCLDLKLLGDPRNFRPNSEVLMTISQSIAAGSWRYSPPKAGVGEEMADKAKVDLLYIALFGRLADRAPGIQGAARLRLACKVVLIDMDGALKEICLAAGQSDGVCRNRK